MGCISISNEEGRVGEDRGGDKKRRIAATATGRKQISVISGDGEEGSQGDAANGEMGLYDVRCIWRALRITPILAGPWRDHHSLAAPGRLERTP